MLEKYMLPYLKNSFDKFINILDTTEKTISVLEDNQYKLCKLTQKENLSSGKRSELQVE